MTAKGARDVLQHPLMDAITKIAIAVSVVMLTTVLGDLSELKQEQAVQGQQVTTLLKTVDARSKQDSRIRALEVGSASKEQMQALKDSMAIMNTELRSLIETRIRESDDRE